MCCVEVNRIHDITEIVVFEKLCELTVDAGVFDASFDMWEFD
jgi:hypothetical protein